MEPQLTEFLSEDLLKFCQGNDLTSEDNEFDSLMLSASEAELGAKPQVTGASSSSMGGARKVRMFAAPKSDEEVARARCDGVPLKCRKTLLGIFLFGTSGESTVGKPSECSFLQQHNLTKLNYASGSAILFWR